MNRILSAAVLIMALGCTSSTGPDDVPDGAFVITPVAAGLQLTNNSDVDLFYQGIDSEALALWAGPSAVTMCSEPNCPHVGAGETLVLLWENVVGWRQNTNRITVYWWRVVSNGQGRWSVDGEAIRSREILIPLPTS